MCIQRHNRMSKAALTDAAEKKAAVQKAQTAVKAEYVPPKEKKDAPEASVSAKLLQQIRKDDEKRRQEQQRKSSIYRMFSWGSSPRIDKPKADLKAASIAKVSDAEASAIFY